MFVLWVARLVEKGFELALRRLGFSEADLAELRRAAEPSDEELLAEADQLRQEARRLHPMTCDVPVNRVAAALVQASASGNGPAADAASPALLEKAAPEQRQAETASPPAAAPAPVISVPASPG